MTHEQREDIKALIAFYEERGLDWSSAVEFLVRKYSETLPWQEQQQTRVGRRRSKEA